MLLSFRRISVVLILTFLIGLSLSKIIPIITIGDKHLGDYSFIVINSYSFLFSSLTLIIILLSFYWMGKLRKQGWLLSYLFVPIIIITTGNGNALCAILVFLSANLLIGFALLQLIKFNRPIDHWYLQLSFFIGLCLNAYIVWIISHFRVNYTVIYYLYFIAQIFYTKEFIPIVYNSVKKSFLSQKTNTGQMVIAIAILYYIFYTLVPQYQFDELIRYLYIAKFVKIQGFWSFDPSFTLSLDLAIIPQYSYNAVYILGGEIAVRILNFVIFIIGLLLLENFARRCFNSKVALFSLLVFILTPFFRWVISAVFIECFVFLGSGICIVYLFCLREGSYNSKEYYLFFIILAFTFLCKLQFISLFIPIMLILTFYSFRHLFRNKSYLMINHTFVGLCLFAIILIPMVFHNYLITGNPVFPWYNEIFKSEWNDTTKFLGQYHEPLTINTFYDITFDGSKYMQGTYPLGILYFVFLPLTPFVININKKRNEIFIILFITFTAIFVWGITAPDTRYLIHVFFSGSIVIGYIINTILDLFRKTKLHYWLIFYISLTFVMNYTLQLAFQHGNRIYPIFYAFFDNIENPSTIGTEQEKELFEYTRVNYGKDIRCLLIDYPAMYYADFHVETDYWHHYINRRDLIFETSNSLQLFKKVFIDKKFDCIIMRDNNITSGSKIAESDEFRDMLNKVFTKNGVGLYFPKEIFLYKTILSEEFIPPIEVTLSNLQYRGFENDYKSYRIKMKINKVSKKLTYGRFQINWLDSNDEYIGSYFKLFEVNELDEYISPIITDIPPNAQKGIMYLTSDNENPIKIHKFQLFTRDR